MADGGQRLLDVIDDPNALESFLGGLTADSELLPSAETVDNVVASLARSLDENEYEVDSPNETLFDTLDSSSNHLTDISRSYVPSDFGQVSVHNDGFSSGLDGFSNGNNNGMRGMQQQHEQHQLPVGTSGGDQFGGVSTNNTVSSVISATSVSNITTVTSSNNLKQISASVSNCDPSKTSSSNFVQSGHIQLTQNSVPSVSNNLNFVFSQDLQKHNIASVSQNQLNQVTSLSSVEPHIQQSVPSNSTNNLISSVVGSGNENGVVGTLTNTTSSNFQLITNTESGHIKAQNLLSNSSQNTSANIQVTSGSSSVSNNNTNLVSVSSTNAVGGVVGSSVNTTVNHSQFIGNTSTHQTTVNHLVSGQTVSIPSMTVSAPQLIANSQGSLVAATAGQNILQQIQSVGSSQSYIAMEQPTALIATGPTTFGTHNVALVTTGGTPTYAVLPTTQQFLTNAIIPQPHTIQTLAKTPNGAYFQTAGTPQIVATSNVNALQNVSVANATSDANSSTIVKPKQPPQLLPKPLSQVNTSVTTNTSSSVTTPLVTSATTDSVSGLHQTALPVTSTSSANTAVTDGVVTQLIQQSQQQISNVSGSTGTVAITPQQTFAIGNAAGIGQVVVSQVSSLNTMTAPQQTQLSGTIVVNQYGQPMLLPTASTAQAGALQLILRQQPTQPQVLTIQTPTGAATLNAQAAAQAATAGGKPIVRYVSQVPQVAQTSGYGLQQIQTPNGPAWVAVRYPQVSQASQFGQIQAESIVSPSGTLQGQIVTSQSQQLQIQTQQAQQVQIQLQQQQNQVIQQSQQQQPQIHLQSGITQSHMQAQQQIQLQGTTQLSQQQTQQQLSLPSQHHGQISNAQHVHQQTQQALGVQMQTSQSMTQNVIPMEQTNNIQTHQNQLLLNRQNEVMLNQSQTQAQYSHEMDQQQISVPDSSSEPPPPKKAKSKSKSSKKKVTLDLEQLLKQSGIMDEDLQDDMSFDFGFMDMQPNGLPPSPQFPPAQIPVINTTETPKKSSSKKSKSNAKKSPLTPLPPPPPPVPVITTPSPSAKSSKKKSSPKKKSAPAPTPPPPLPPPPPPVITPTKSKSSKKKAGPINDYQKPETKTASSKKTVPPKKISSLDTLLATIDAVAAAAGASSSYSPFRKSPSPPPSLPTPSRKPTPSPKNKRSKSKSASTNSMLPAPSLVKSETPNFSISSAPIHVPPISTLPHFPLTTPGTIIPQPTITPNVSVAAPSLSPSLQAAPAPSINSVAPSPPRVSGSSLTNGSSTATSTNSGVTRVVQTIQLTPQNQQLLRNIQSQIQRLCSLPKRSETEQSALQKLVVLQQQVIATGIPVPNPAHLNNLAQSVNVESINLATPSATVPSSDTATASPSSAMSPLFPLLSESDVSTNPVSSTVTTATMPVLANPNLINSTKLNSSKPSTNGCSPVPNTAATASVGSSYGAGIVGSPSVSSTASPDSTSNLSISLGYDQISSLPPATLSNTGIATATSVNSGGGGNIVVSNVNADLGQLIASVSVASSEDKLKENTQGKGSFGATTTVPVTSSSVNSSATLSQHHLPPTSSYMPSTFTTRSAVDDKRVEEQRLANLKSEEEKRARWKKEEFEMLLQRDQQYVVKPDYEVPFPTKKDAVERLMKYHIYRDRNDMNFEEFDAEFGNNAGILLEKFSVMMFKYRNLLLKESMKEVGCAERVMLERMFVSEEKVRLEQDRLLVAQGDVLELPTPPESWIPKVKEMVDKEMMEFEPLDPVVSQQVQSAVDSIIGCESNDATSYLMEEGDKIEYDAFGVPINSSGYAGLNSASSADIDEAVRSILS